MHYTPWMKQRKSNAGEEWIRIREDTAANEEGMLDTESKEPGNLKKYATSKPASRIQASNIQSSPQQIKNDENE